MIIRNNEATADARINMRDGAGTVTLHHYLGEKKPANCRLFSRISLPAGASIGEHVHEKECELFYFLGEGTVLDDGKEIPIHAGDVMVTDDGHSHSVINSGNQTLELIAVIITK